MIAGDSDVVSVTVVVSTVHAGFIGGAVFTGRGDDGRWIRAVASRGRIVRAPLKGESWHLSGRYTQHPTYGEQLQIEGARLIRPAGKHLVSYLSSYPAFRGTGVGPAKASRLSEHFGERLPDILAEGQVQELEEVISRESASKLITSWREVAEEGAVMVFLDRHGIDHIYAEKITRFWPRDAVEKLTENPYRLLAFTSWEIADRLALSLGLDLGDRRRLIAAAEAAVYVRLDDAKDTLVETDILEADIKKLLRCIGNKIPAIAIEQAVVDGSLTGNRDKGYQATGCALMERYLSERLTTAAAPSSQIALIRGNRVDHRVEYCIRAFEQGEGVSLSEEQRDAVYTACSATLSIITGGAGSGKTTVLRVIHRAVEYMGGAVVQMALAGRAAQRMREATGRDAYTIASFLDQVSSGYMNLTEKHLVVIDECSMVDLLLMYRVLRALPQGVRLLLVGDPNQLPPIGPGLVFHVLAESKIIPVEKLVKVHRQNESSGIPAVADKIRKGVVPDLPKYDGSRAGVSFQACEVSYIPELLTALITDLGGPSNTQILNAIKNGPAGVKSINSRFHKMNTARRVLGRWGIGEGDPVVYTVNDYNLDLYNGSLGTVQAVLDGDETIGNYDEPARLLCSFDGRAIKLSDSHLSNVELAYAITIHKAQGSQFKRVVIPITWCRILDRTLIYTALTRGVEQVVFVGDKNAFHRAIENPPTAYRRNIGFTV